MVTGESREPAKRLVKTLIAVNHIFSCLANRAPNLYFRVDLIPSLIPFCLCDKDVGHQVTLSWCFRLVLFQRVAGKPLNQQSKPPNRLAAQEGMRDWSQTIQLVVSFQGSNAAKPRFVPFRPHFSQQAPGFFQDQSHRSPKGRHPPVLTLTPRKQSNS